MDEWNEIMFSNIGNKIKGYAKFVAWLGIFLSILSGIILFFYGLFNIENFWYFMLLGPAAAILGCILSWLSVIVFYGFGELIDTTTTINKKMDKLTDIETHKSKSGTVLNFDGGKEHCEPKPKNDIGIKGKLKYKCNNCKELIDFSDTKCPWCGYLTDLDELPKSSNNTKSYLEEYKNKFKAEQKQDTGNHEKMKYRCNNCKEFIDFSDTKCPWCGYDNFGKNNKRNF